MKRVTTPQPDPADALNKKVLDDRAKRVRVREHKTLVAQEAEEAVINELNPAPPAEPATAHDFIDGWDKQAFGTPLPTYKKIIYGPDPLLQANPGLRDKIEAVGLEEYARATYETMLLKGPLAVPDPMMQRGLAACIAKFGVKNTARSFAERIMKIPFREVEIEADREDYMLLQDPLRDAVERYGRTGFSPKFMSDRSRAVLGDRGYIAVKDQRGDIVKVGTLMMFEIPERIAAARKRKAMEQSQAAVDQQEENYIEAAERFIAEAGARGSRPLASDEVMRANATESEDYIGQARPSGIRFERER